MILEKFRWAFKSVTRFNSPGGLSLLWALSAVACPGCPPGLRPSPILSLPHDCLREGAHLGPGTYLLRPPVLCDQALSRRKVTFTPENMASSASKATVVMRLIMLDPVASLLLALLPVKSIFSAFSALVLSGAFRRRLPVPPSPSVSHPLPTPPGFSLFPASQTHTCYLPHPTLLMVPPAH